MLNPISVNQISLLRKMLCVLSCRPGGKLADKMQDVLGCLVDALGVEAAGIFWKQGEQVTRQAQLPVDFTLNQAVYRAIVDPARFDEVIEFTGNPAWLVVPMRVQGITLGRLWVVWTPYRPFGANERELLILAGNQLAMAWENLRLYQEMSYVAERRGALVRRFINMQDERCRRVSRELHDEISQSLTALAFILDTAATANPQAAGALHPYLEQCRRGLEQAANEIDRIILELRPTLLEDYGLVAALRWYGTERLRPTGTTLRIISDGKVCRLPAELETTLYRIGQEAINNVARHAYATTAWLSIYCQNGTYHLSVRDNGRGFDVQELFNTPQAIEGVGLFGIQERVALVGGSFSLDSKPGAGTCINVAIPTGKDNCYEAN